MIGWRGVVSYHLRSIVGDIKLIVLCARVGYFDVQIKETLLYK
jgi:hypothetical protein